MEIQVIKFFVFDDFGPIEIHPKLLKVYNNVSCSFYTVKKWAALFTGYLVFSFMFYVISNSEFH